MKPVVIDYSIPLKASISSVWKKLADTNLTNYGAGMNPVQLRPLLSHGAARYLAKTRIAGFKVTYEEEPYEWTKYKFLKISRVMLDGPSTLVRMSYRLDKIDKETCIIKLCANVMPRFAVLRPVVYVATSLSVRNIAHYFRQTFNNEANHLWYFPEYRHLLQTYMDRRDKMDLVEIEIWNRLLAISPIGAQHIRPLEWTEIQGVSDQKLVETCDKLVGFGVLEKVFQAICPSCRSGEVASTPAAVMSEHFFCHFCEINFACDATEKVEQFYRVSPTLVGPYLQTYCAGGPAKTPHVFCQIVIPARGYGAVSVPPDDSDYRLVFRGGNAVRLQYCEGEVPHFPLDVRELMSKTRISVNAGKDIQLMNPFEYALHAKVEDTKPKSTVLTYKQVLEWPNYQHHFHEKAL